METPGEALLRRRNEYISRIMIFDGVESDPRVDMRPVESRRFFAGGDDIPDACLPDSGVRPVRRPPAATGDDLKAAQERLLPPGEGNQRTTRGDWDAMVNPPALDGTMSLARITTILRRACELIREGQTFDVAQLLDLTYATLPDHRDTDTSESIARAYGLLRAWGCAEYDMAQLFDTVLDEGPWDSEEFAGTAKPADLLRARVRGVLFDVLERYVNGVAPFTGVLSVGQQPAPAPVTPQEPAKGGDDCACWPVPGPAATATATRQPPVPPVLLSAVTGRDDVRDAVLAGIGVSPPEVATRLGRLGLPDDVIARLLNWLTAAWAPVPTWQRRSVATPEWSARKALADPAGYLAQEGAPVVFTPEGVAATSAFLGARDVVAMLMMVAGWVGLATREVVARLALRDYEKNAGHQPPVTYFTPAGDISAAGEALPFLVEIRAQLRFDEYPARVVAHRYAVLTNCTEGYTRFVKVLGATPGGLADSITPPTMDPLSAFYWRSTVLDGAIAHMFQLADTADFGLNTYLRFLGHFRRGGIFRPAASAAAYDERVERFLAGAIPDWFLNLATVAVLRMKFWVTDPATPNTDQGEMSTWSENHQILFGTGEYLAGQWWPGEQFPYANLRGSDHRDRARTRVKAWLHNRMRFGLTEMNSAIYLNEHLPPLFNLVDFAADQDVRTLATMVVDLLVFDMVRHSCRGSYVAASVRAYPNGKISGFRVSVVDTLQMLTGLPGDVIGTGEETANALATSTYLTAPPEAILAIAAADAVPVVARSRVSIGLADGAAYGIGTTSDDDVMFWWSHAAYFTEQTYEATHDHAYTWHLTRSGPFKLFSTTDSPLMRALGSAGELLVPNLPSPGDPIRVLRAVGDLLTSPFSSHDDKPSNESMIQQELKKLAIEVNAGSVAERLHLSVWRSADAMLSSLNDEKKGGTSFQKEVCVASLGPAVSVFVSKPLDPSPTVPALIKAAQGFGVGQLENQEFWKTIPAELGAGDDPMPEIGKVLAALGPTVFADEVFSDGPGYFQGEASNPLVWQHENVAVVIYNPGDLQRGYSHRTHAFWPWEHFDEVRTLLRAGGQWIFGRCDRRFPPRTPCPPDVRFPDGTHRVRWPTKDNPFPTYEPAPPEPADGSGYVALFSANGLKTTPVPVDARAWLAELATDKSPVFGAGWQHRELAADGHENIWIIVVGDQRTYGSFRKFVDDVLAHDPDLSVGDHRCALTMPVPGAFKGAKGATFSVDWGTGAKVDGAALTTDGWPRFELATSGLAASGESIPYGIASTADPGKGRVDFDETGWRIQTQTTHTVLGRQVPFTVYLEHDFSDPDHPVRRLNRVPPDVLDPGLTRDPPFLHASPLGALFGRGRLRLPPLRPAPAPPTPTPPRS